MAEVELVPVVFAERGLVDPYLPGNIGLFDPICGQRLHQLSLILSRRVCLSTAFHLGPPGTRMADCCVAVGGGAMDDRMPILEHCPDCAKVMNIEKITFSAIRLVCPSCGRRVSIKPPRTPAPLPPSPQNKVYHQV